MVCIKRSRTGDPERQSLDVRAPITKGPTCGSLEPAGGNLYACYFAGCGKRFTKKWNLKSSSEAFLYQHSGHGLGPRLDDY
jgi:hypothetical protein